MDICTVDLPQTNAAIVGPSEQLRCTVGKTDSIHKAGMGKDAYRQTISVLQIPHSMYEGRAAVTDGEGQLRLLCVAVELTLPGHQPMLLLAVHCLGPSRGCE